LQVDAAGWRRRAGQPRRRAAVGRERRFIAYCGRSASHAGVGLIWRIAAQ